MVKTLAKIILLPVLVGILAQGYHMVQAYLAIEESNCLKVYKVPGPEMAAIPLADQSGIPLSEIAVGYHTVEDGEMFIHIETFPSRPPVVRLSAHICWVGESAFPRPQLEDIRRVVR